MPELVKKAAEVTSIGVQAGEGWLLTAEILELIEQGCPNVICAQPFACLPNHVTGRGMFGKIRRLHPEANIVSIDYDPGASEANQLNRIKLMIAAAKKAHNAKFADDRRAAGLHCRRLTSNRRPTDARSAPDRRRPGKPVCGLRQGGCPIPYGTGHPPYSFWCFSAGTGHTRPTRACLP